MNKDTEQTAADEEDVTEIDLTANEADNTSNPGSTTLLKLLLGLCLLGLIALAGTLYWVVEQGRQELTALESEVSSQLQQGLAELAQQRQADAQSVSQQQQALQQLQSSQTAIEQTLSLLSAEQPDNNLDWSLAEVEQLIVIAIQQLQLAKNPQTAIAALDSADQRLRNLADPGLLPIRQQLTKDINRLKAVNQVDIAGISLYLSDLIAKVNSLPLKDSGLTMPAAGAANNDAGTMKSDSWLDKLSGLGRLIWQELKTMVVIKHKDNADNAFILPEQEYFLYENLRLELTNAKLAVLSRDSANLHSSIDSISAWLEQHFKTSDAAISNILEALQQMQALELQPELPDISSSLETLRATLRQQGQTAPN